MRCWIGAVLLGLWPGFVVGGEPPPDPVRFLAAFDEARQLVKLGRRLEGRALLGNLAWRLDHFEPATRYRFAERLAEALEALEDFEGVERVQDKVVDTCVLDSTHSTAAVADLPRQPRARGLELCRLALALPASATQRRMLLRGALTSLLKVADRTAETEHRMGLCWLELGRREQAVERFRSAIAMDPESPGPRVALARLYLADRKPADALAILERGLERGLEREGVQLLADVVQALDAAGDGPRARAAAGAWSARSTDGRTMAPIWIVDARFAEQDGRLVDALRGYCRVIEVEPGADAVHATVRTARALAGRGVAERHLCVATLTKSVKPDGAAHPELLRVAGELALRDADPLTAIRMYGAGLARPATRGTFEPLLTELRHGFRATAKLDLATEVDMAFGAPKFSEPDKTYAVVQLGPDRCAVDTIGGTIAGKLPANAKLARFATVVAQVMKEYPREFVGKLRLWKFELTEAPIVAGATWIGVADPDNATVHVNITTPVNGPDDWRIALHHELFHLVDQQDDGITAKDLAWRKLNRAGFLYTANKDVPCEPITSANGPPVPGFVNAYATSGEEEDKAVTFANMMVYLPVLEERAAHDAVLAAKIERVRQMMRAFVPAMNDAFWDALRAKSSPTATASN